MSTKKKTANGLFKNAEQISLQEFHILTAIDQYDHLFVKDWIARYRLNETAHQELLSLLADFYFFIEDKNQST